MIFPNRVGKPLNPSNIRNRVIHLLLTKKGRYSGMRIGDAVSLSADRLEGKRLFLYTQKTVVPVYTVLPDFVLKALEETPRVNHAHYFGQAAGK